MWVVNGVHYIHIGFVFKRIHGIESPFFVCPCLSFKPIVIMVSTWCFAVYSDMIMAYDAFAVSHDGAYVALVDVCFALSGYVVICVAALVLFG